MNVELEDYETGWYGIKIGIKESEIDIMIERLKSLKKEKDRHFHLSSSFEEEGGVADIEFFFQRDGNDNMWISGFEISPNR